LFSEHGINIPRAFVEDGERVLETGEDRIVLKREGRREGGREGSRGDGEVRGA